MGRGGGGQGEIKRRRITQQKGGQGEQSLIRCFLQICQKLFFWGGKGIILNPCAVMDAFSWHGLGGGDSALVVGFQWIQFQMPQQSAPNLGAPWFGVGRRGSPRFVPLSLFLPICSDLRFLFTGIPRFVPICSDLLRFLPICSELFSEQIRTNQGNPFLPTLCKSSKIADRQFLGIAKGGRGAKRIVRFWGRKTYYRAPPPKPLLERAKNLGRPRPKVCFPAAPVTDFDPQAFGLKGLDVRGKIRFVPPWLIPTCSACSSPPSRCPGRLPCFFVLFPCFGRNFLAPLAFVERLALVFQRFGGRREMGNGRQDCFERTVSEESTHSQSSAANSVSSAKKKLGEFALAHK